MTQASDDTQNKVAYLLRGNNDRRAFLRTSEVDPNGYITRWDPRDTNGAPNVGQLAIVTPRQAKLGEMLRKYDDVVNPTSMLGAILAELIDRLTLTQVQERAFRRDVIARYVARQTGEGQTVDYDSGGL